VQQRLSRLSPTAQRVVQAAAVLQSDFDLELVAEVLGSDPLELIAVWEELERAQILSGDHFSHDLLSEAVAAAMSQQVGALLHRRSAKVLAERGGIPVRIAKHFLACGDDDKAAPYLMKAAQGAKDTLRLAEAAERYERAGDIFERLGERAQAFEAYRLALRVRLEFDLGSDIEHALVKLRGAAKTPLTRAMAWRLATEWHMRRGEYPETEAAAQRGLQELEESDDARARIELLTFLAAALARQGRADESAASLQQLLALAEAVNGATDGWLSVQLSHAASVLDDLSRSREALVYHRRALSLESNVRERLVQLADYGFSLLSLGEAQRALETLSEARAQLEGVTDVPVAECMILTYLGAAQHNLSRYTEALESFETALRVTFRHKQHMQSKGAFICRARVWLTLGCFDEAAADLAHALEEPQKPFSSGQVYIEITSGRLKVLQGRDASEHFQKAEYLLAGRSPRLLAHLRIDQAATPLAQGLDFVEEALMLAQTLELPGLEIGARTRYAQQLLALGEIPEALSHARRAVELLGAFSPVDFYSGEVFLTYYQALEAAHDPQARVQLGHCLTHVIGVADHHVPATYRDNFLGKNPINRVVFEEAKRIGLQVDRNPTEYGVI
jgi:tetratricopeptide (TPR) repeat protein